MMDLGTAIGFMVMQLITIGVLAMVPALAIVALVVLFRNRPESDTALAVWALIVLIVPVLGPIAYFMSRSIRPANQDTAQRV